jgi:peroxiredoxin
MGKRMMPANVQLVIDPDYTFVDAYGLRWDAPRETAYPSTFLIDKAGIVRWTKISRTHGDRSRARDVLAELTKAGG